MMRKLAVGVLTSLILIPAVLAQEPVKTTRVMTPRIKTATSESELTTRREQFRLKLQNIEDVRKKTIAEKVNTLMCSTRDNRVRAMTSHLQTMTNILTRVEERANEAQTRGKDITTITAAIATAHQAIADAQTSVAALSSFACDLAISGDETKLGPEIKTARTALQTQIQATYVKISSARKAVGEAIRTLARVLGEPVPAPVTTNKTNE